MKGEASFKANKPGKPIQDVTLKAVYSYNMKDWENYLVYDVENETWWTVMKAGKIYYDGEVLRDLPAKALVYELPRAAVE